MRKNSLLTLVLACFATFGWAQGTASHFTLCDDAQSSSVKMTVTAILDLSKTDYYYWGLDPRYEVAAFIEGECHAIAMEGDNSDNGYWEEREDYKNWFILRIPYSTARSGKPITFKLYNSKTGLEYTLKNGDDIRSRGINMGTDSSPIVLKAVEMKEMDFNDFEMKVNTMHDLASKLTFTPSNATCPNNLDFSIYPGTYTLKVTGNGGYQFSPTAAGTYSVEGVAGKLGVRFRDGEITVTRATNYVSGLSINSGYETIEVAKGDADMLGDMLARALKVSYYYNYEPDEYPEWVSSDESIVGPDATGRLTPKKKGTCTLTAQVKHPVTGAVRLSASLTVKVTNDIGGLDVLHDRLSCYVGDDLTDYLPRAVETVPSDADTPTFDYQVVRGSDVLEKRADGHIVAVGSGTATVQVTARGGLNEFSVNVTVNVQNAYNDVSIAQPVLNIKYTGAGAAQDITSAVKGNISYLPATANYFASYGPNVTSNNPSVVSVEMVATATGTSTDLTATAYSTGTATITVTLETPDLLEESVATIGTYVAPKTVTKSFDVIMASSAPTAIELPDDVTVNLGQTVDLAKLITFEPEDAQVDYSQLRWSSPMTGASQYYTIENNILTAVKPTMNGFPLMVTYTADMSTIRSANMWVYIPNPAQSITVNEGYAVITTGVGTDYENDLSLKLRQAFTISPQDHTDVLVLTSADETIVKKKEYSDNMFTPLKKGTTTVTAAVYDYKQYDDNGQKTDGLSPKLVTSVTVVVATAPTSLTLPAELRLKRGETLDLKTVLTYTPDDADIDWTKVQWSSDDRDAEIYFDIKDNILTAKYPEVYGCELTATLPVEGRSLTATTKVCITQNATAVTVKDGDEYRPVIAYVGENDDLEGLLGVAFNLDPYYATDRLVITIEDPTIVSLDDAGYKALKPGTTKVTATAYDYFDTDNTKPIAQNSVTVEVRARLKDVALPSQLVVNMGETLDLAKQLILTPTDAYFDYTKLRWTWSSGMDSYLDITNNVLTPKKPYRGSITLTATVEGSDVTLQTRLYILQPATALTVKSGSEKIEVFVGQSTELTDAVYEAFVVTPENTTDVLVYTIEDETVVENERDVTFYPKKKGTTKVTATLYDLLDSDTRKTPRFSQTIEVVVKQELKSFWFDDREYSLNVGQTLDLKNELKLSPADADIDLSQVVWAVEDNTKARIENGVLTALAPTAPDYVTVTATLGSIEASTILYIYQPATGITVNSGYETLTISVGENTRLNDFLDKAVTLSPANTTDRYNWLIADESVITYDDELNCYVALKAGTTKATAYVGRDFAEATLKADVTITVLPLADGLSMPERVIVKMDETLDLTTVLTITPPTALFDYTKVKWSYNEDFKQVFVIENNILKPVAPYMRGVILTATATVGGEQLTASTIVYISNPAKSLSVREGYEKITVHVYEDEAMKEKVRQAFIVDPENCTDPMVITIENDEIIFADPFREGNYVVLRPGTTKLTATIYNYFDEQHTKPLFSETITVEVLPAVESISLPETMEMNEGETIKLDDVVTMNLYPNQNYHPANLIWTIEKGKEKLANIDDDHVLTALQKGTLTLTAAVPYTDIKASTVLTILRPATELSIVNGFETVYTCVGSKRLPDILEDGLFSLPLGHTDKVEWLLADDGILEVADDGVLTPVKAGTTKIRAYIGNKANPRLQTDEWTVEVGLQITAVSAKEPLLTLMNDVYSRNTPITPTLKDNFELTPEARLVDYNPMFESSNVDVVTVSDIGVPDDDGVRPVVLGSTAGRTTITVTITVPDYNNTSRNGKPNKKQLQGSCDIEVEMGLQGLAFDNIDMVMGEDYELRLRKIPEDAKFDFDVSKFKIVIEHADGREFPSGWDYVSCRPSDNDPLTFTLDSKCVGQGYVFVIYDGLQLAGGGAPNINVRPRYSVGNGWQWLALYDGSLKNQADIKDVFGDNLVEVRSSDALLVNDPEIGYIGDLTQMTPGKTYKLNLNLKELPDEGLTFTNPSGAASIFTGSTIEARQPWNWIGNPYQYYQSISDIFAGNDFTTDDKVVTKDAFATWDGFKWVGSLTHVTPGEGLLLYLRYGDKLKLNAETDMKQIVTMPATARTAAPAAEPLRSLRAEVAAASRRHADHANVIATVEGRSSQAQTVVLAFVGDECRGYSVVDADRHFITVHGEAGEPVHFVVYDELTGLYHSVEGRMNLTEQRGTLAEPVRLSAGEAQAVLSVALSKQQAEKTYDLQGRRVDSLQDAVHGSQLQRGVYIRGGKKVVRH